MKQLFENIQSGAVLSNCRKYRYRLWRIWDDSKPKILWIMLNPSKADETVNDATIKKIMRMSNRWGYGGIYVGNLYAFRATDPKELKPLNYYEATGGDNYKHVVEMASLCEMKILAHGNPPMAFTAYRDMIEGLHYLKLTTKGHPYHPLYLKETLTPIKF